jgi:hypothetical protein
VGLTREPIPPPHYAQSFSLSLRIAFDSGRKSGLDSKARVTPVFIFVFFFLERQCRACRAEDEDHQCSRSAFS